MNNTSTGTSQRRRHLVHRPAQLSASDLFCDLTPEDMAWIGRIVTTIAHRKGEVFYGPEHRDDCLFLLRKGRVRLFRTPAEGQKKVITTLEPGAIFGRMAFIAQAMHGASAEALEDCTLWRMGRREVEQVLLAKPQVALRLIEALARRIRETEARLEDIIYKTVSARLASLLLRLRERQGNVITGFTHQDLADMIGTYRETTTQTLNAFKEKKLLRIGRKRLEILDVEGLRAIAMK